MELLGRAWRYTKDAVDGLKTLGVAAVFILLGLADWYDIVDIKPLLTMVLGDNVAAKIMVVLPVLFGTLRFVSSGAVKWTRAWREDKAETVDPAADGPADFNKGAQ
jgi:hypothetical protein